MEKMWGEGCREGGGKGRGGGAVRRARGLLTFCPMHDPTRKLQPSFIPPLRHEMARMLSVDNHEECSMSNENPETKKGKNPQVTKALLSAPSG